MMTSLKNILDILTLSRIFFSYTEPLALTNYRRHDRLEKYVNAWYVVVSDLEIHALSNTHTIAKKIFRCRIIVEVISYIKEFFNYWLVVQFVIMSKLWMTLKYPCQPEWIGFFGKANAHKSLTGP